MNSSANANVQKANADITALAVEDIQVPILEWQGHPLLEPVAFGDGKTSLSEMVRHFNVAQGLAAVFQGADQIFQTKLGGAVGRRGRHRGLDPVAALLIAALAEEQPIAVAEDAHTAMCPQHFKFPATGRHTGRFDAVGKEHLKDAIRVFVKPVVFNRQIAREELTQDAHDFGITQEKTEGIK